MMRSFNRRRIGPAQLIPFDFDSIRPIHRGRSRNHHQPRPIRLNILPVFQNGQIGQVSQASQNNQTNQTNKNQDQNPPSLCFKYSETPQTECCVCMEKYKAGDYVTMFTCSHRFHKQCVDTWVEKSGDKHCLVCRVYCP